MVIVDGFDSQGSNSDGGVGAITAWTHFAPCAIGNNLSVTTARGSEAWNDWSSPTMPLTFLWDMSQ